MSNKKSSRKSNKNINNHLKQILFLIVLAIIIQLTGYFSGNINYTSSNSNVISATLENIPEYSGSPYIEINNNIPSFDENDYTTKPFETYSDLDSLGRCGIAYANICKEVMPSKNEQRESISKVKPSGWKNAVYDIVDGNYLYNRCHLIGYQLAGENANEKNLITGTRYMNVDGMLPFENEVANYIEEHSNNHVLYRVIPIFEYENLVASGVQIEAYSVEDNGSGVCFNVYVYNIQPGIVINYSTGNSKLEVKSE